MQAFGGQMDEPDVELPDENEGYDPDGHPFDDDDDYYEVDPGDEDYIEQVQVQTSLATAKFASESGLDLSFLLDDEIRKQWQGHNNWNALWTGIDLKIDPCQAAADYYLLFGIANNSFVEIIPQYYPTSDELRSAGQLLEVDNKTIDARVLAVKELSDLDPTLKLEKFNRDADTLYRTLTDRLDESFRQYSHLACGGEVRYMLKSDPFYTNDRHSAWAAWYFVYEKYGLKSLEIMVELFNKNGFGAVGGARWAAATEVLLGRESGTLGPDELSNKQIFIDRVFTLQHNTGSFLNKLSWANNRVGRSPGGGNWAATMRDNVLPAHCANPVDIRTMYHYASEGVQQLLTKYFDLALAHGLEVNGIWEEKKPAIVIKTAVKNPSQTTLNWDDEPDFDEDPDDEDPDEGNPCEEMVVLPTVQDIKNVAQAAGKTGTIFLAPNLATLDKPSTNIASMSETIIDIIVTGPEKACSFPCYLYKIAEFPMPTTPDTITTFSELENFYYIGKIAFGDLTVKVTSPISLSPSLVQKAIGYGINEYLNV